MIGTCIVEDESVTVLCDVRCMQAFNMYFSDIFFFFFFFFFFFCVVAISNILCKNMH